MSSRSPLWQPNPDEVRSTVLWRFMRCMEVGHRISLSHYEALHRWSVTSREDFWRSLWSFCEVIGTPGERVLVDGDRMPGARWFPDAQLNFAENLLWGRDDALALVFRGEDRVWRRMTLGELRHSVSRAAQAMVALGLAPGDRVAAFLPNAPEAVIAMLAASSIGAVFSSCSPDFGVQGVLDRFGQIAPKLLIACDGYVYAGKAQSVLPKVADVVRALPSLRRTVIVPYGIPMDAADVPGAQSWEDFVAPHSPGPIDFRRLPFDHPLYILYSSGTTGVPKCIVHGAGGTLLQHLKEHRLHCDIQPGDRVFYFTTCGWMMWNWLVSALASEATLVLYDGSPFHPDPTVLFDYADDEAINIFGVSAKYLDGAAKAALQPRRTHRLEGLKSILSTGSPLSPEGFDYVYEKIKRDVRLSSISGGTDIISCFALGNPLLPVWRGELQCVGLGMRVEVFDEAARPLRGAKGELVCSAPFPSMPIGFWNDPDGSRYRAAYFQTYPGVWRHGDWAEITQHDGLIIYGRSDAVLNPGGVRIGTAEIYRQVEQLPEVLESLAIGQEWQGDVRVVLFVRLREGMALNDGLRAQIRERIRKNASPRHVPAKIIQVADIPRTRSGKIVELAVRDVVHGRPVKNREALANPEALALFEGLGELRS